MQIDSILNSTKKSLGYHPEYAAFDPEILMHINSVLSDLNDLGVGPAEGFQVTGADETWAQFLGSDLRLNAVKTYVNLRLRMIFDPPANSFTQTAFKEQIKEWEWRLREYMEGGTWQTELTPSP